MRSIIARSLSIEAHRTMRGTIKRCIVDCERDKKIFYSSRHCIAAHDGVATDTKNRTLILAFVYKVYFNVQILCVAAKSPRALKIKKIFAPAFAKNDFSS